MAQIDEEELEDSVGRAPGAVGAGSFWTGMVDYADGESAQSVADAIQASWDALK